MGGWPVWLASLARRDRRGVIVGTDRWSADELAEAQAQLDSLLAGVGNPEQERSFRMMVTLCRHRALTQAEHDALPAAWHAEPAFDVAGGPVEVLWHHGVPDPPSTQPCEQPSRVPLSSDGRLWFPGDCGSCVPCVAREAAAEGPCACAR